jgi:outer membrane murein-binding lipoprotein Lpp
MMRLLAFVLSLLLLAGVIEPIQGWLIALTVLTGLAAVRFKLWAPWILRPALDFRMAAFVLAVLLLAGTVDASREWLIGLSVVTGIACFM